jgi:hypothetical protein
MNDSFSGMISIEDKDPKNHEKHNPIQQDDTDPRVSVIKEYVLKVPNASLKDLKKALIGFSKASEEDLKNIIKLADEVKFNELFPQTDIIQSPIHTHMGVQFHNKEVTFLEKYRTSTLNRRDLYALYKQEFPNSNRNIKFLSDYYYHYKKPYVENKVELTKSNNIQPIHKSTNDHILAQAITALYKSGKSPKMFLKVKPIIELIKDPEAIEFAIECLTL